MGGFPAAKACLRLGEELIGGGLKSLCCQKPRGAAVILAQQRRDLDRQVPWSTEYFGCIARLTLRTGPDMGDIGKTRAERKGLRPRPSGST